MPRASLSAIFNLAAAHRLIDYHGECENFHGHNYKIIVQIEGLVQKNGLVLDFKEIKKIYQEKVHAVLDHQNLNDFIPNPSAENLAIWLWKKMQADLPLQRITIYETDNYFCKYEGK